MQKVSAIMISSIYLFLLMPVLFIIWVSFFDSSFLTFPPPGYTLKWYAKAFSTSVFINGFMTSLYIATIASTISIISGTIAALALVRQDFPGKDILNALLLSPLIVPNIVLGIALYVFFIYVADTYFFDPIANDIGIIIAHSMLVLPWSVRIIGANLIGMNKAIEEAAYNLGANSRTVFLRITFPMMRGGIIAAALFSFIISFENLELSLLLVPPGHTTLPITLMQYLEFNMDPTIAAVSTVQVAVIAAALIITDRFFKLSRIVQ